MENKLRARNLIVNVLYHFLKNCGNQNETKRFDVEVLKDRNENDCLFNVLANKIDDELKLTINISETLAYDHKHYRYLIYSVFLFFIEYMTLHDEINKIDKETLIEELNYSDGVMKLVFTKFLNNNLKEYKEKSKSYVNLRLYDHYLGLTKVEIEELYSYNVLDNPNNLKDKITFIYRYINLIKNMINTYFSAWNYDSIPKYKEYEIQIECIKINSIKGFYVARKQIDKDIYVSIIVTEGLIKEKNSYELLAFFLAKFADFYYCFRKEIFNTPITNENKFIFAYEIIKKEVRFYGDINDTFYGKYCAYYNLIRKRHSNHLLVSNAYRFLMDLKPKERKEYFDEYMVRTVKV